MKLALTALTSLLVACGGGFSDADSTAVTNSARLSLATLAAEQGVDGGGPLRALSRANFCAVSSVLARHSKPVPDAGSIQCAP